MAQGGDDLSTLPLRSCSFEFSVSFAIPGFGRSLCLNTVKGELNPEMKLCELLVLGHCIHLPLILFACASSGQSYNVGSPVPPNFCDVIDTAMTGDPIAF